eukprot:886310-Alexandrium_andersonii.AAC.1
MEGLPADQGPANQPPPAPEQSGTDPYGCPYVFRSLQDVSFTKCASNEHRQELMGAFTRRGYVPPETIPSNRLTSAAPESRSVMEAQACRRLGPEG